MGSPDRLYLYLVMVSEDLTDNGLLGIPFTARVVILIPLKSSSQISGKLTLKTLPSYPFEEFTIKSIISADFFAI
jgi:hypothetical protein